MRGKFKGLIKSRVRTAQGKQQKLQNKFPVRKNTGNLEILSKHRETAGNLVCSSCKLPDYKGKSFLKFAAKISQKILKLDKSVKSVFCVL